MTIAMQPIYTQTIGATAGGIVFNNIPQTFTDLKVVVSTRTNANGESNEVCSDYDTQTKMQNRIATLLSNSPEFQNSQAAAFNRERERLGVSTLGEISIPACAAFDNSGAGAIGKALQDVSTQFGTGLANGMGSGM